MYIYCIEKTEVIHGPSLDHKVCLTTDGDWLEINAVSSDPVDFINGWS
jgi:hypothetical protein